VSLLQDRLRIEAESLQEMHRHCPAHVPQVFKFDLSMYVIAMQYLAPPHAVLRYGILDGQVYPRLAEHAAEQLACCLFRTSMHKLGSAEFNKLADRFSNPEMCQLTEQVRIGRTALTICTG
jgi:5-methylthioribose kinase